MSKCVAILCAVVLAGCGKSDGLLRTKCQVVKGGENWVTPEGQHLQIEFVPFFKEGQPLKSGMCYAADVDQDTGVFRPDGPLKQGMPPGKYRVVMALVDAKKKDVFEGKFDLLSTPYIFDFDEDTEEPFVIDLDDPPATQAALYGAGG
jgi:hypothetical protein